VAGMEEWLSAVGGGRECEREEWGGACHVSLYRRVATAPRRLLCHEQSDRAAEAGTEASVTEMSERWAA
jgi:hypothetical protein